jgi:ornithine cyclodeaminase
VRYLTDTDVAALVAPADALDAVTRAFASLASGTAAVQARVRTSAGDAKLSTLGAVLADEGVLGAKVYSTIDGHFTFAVVLFSADDGRRLALLDGAALTRLRTAATSVLAAEASGVRAPRHLALFGKGAQASGHAAAFCDRFGPARVTVVTRDPGEPLGEAWSAVEARQGRPAERAALDCAQAVLADADVVVTATRASTPLFPGTWLAPGAHVCAVGSSRLDARELDDDAYRRADLVCVEWRAQARAEAGGLRSAIDAGFLAWSDVVELADLVRSPYGERHAGAITVYQSVGIGIEDVAVATVAWRAAEESGAGVVLRPA